MDSARHRAGAASNAASPHKTGDTNASTERLKQDAIQSDKAAGSFWAQQRIFDRFRHEYNEERPHEALSDKPPASRYEPSSRRYPTKLVEPEYGDDIVVYRVKSNGTICHEGRDLFLSSTLRGQPVGLTGHDDGKLGRFTMDRCTLGASVPKVG